MRYTHIALERASVKKHKDASSTTTVTVTDTQSEELTAEEERILRMRSGATLEHEQELGSKLDGVAEAHRADVAKQLAEMEARIIAALQEEPELRTDRKKRILKLLKETD